MERGKRQAHTMMRLRRRKFDASKSKPEWQAFSDFVASLICGAGSQARRLVQVASVSQHQGFALRISTYALIGIGSRSSGPLPQHCTYGSVYSAWPAIRRDVSAGKSSPHQVSIGP
jgi:hypothetical protein